MIFSRADFGTQSDEGSIHFGPVSHGRDWCAKGSGYGAAELNFGWLNRDYNMGTEADLDLFG